MAYFTLFFAPVPVSAGEEAEISERSATITVASNDRNPTVLVKTVTQRVSRLW